MLVLSRKIGETITVGNSVSITVLSYDRGVVRLGIVAPKNIAIHRKEIYDKIIDANRTAAKTEFNALKKAISDSQLFENIKDVQLSHSNEISINLKNNTNSKNL